jgi:hypothetical protein
MAVCVCIVARLVMCMDDCVRVHYSQANAVHGWLCVCIVARHMQHMMASYMGIMVVCFVHGVSVLYVLHGSTCTQKKYVCVVYYVAATQACMRSSCIRGMCGGLHFFLGCAHTLSERV